MRSGWGSFHVGARVGTVGSNVPLGRCAMLVHGCSERQRSGQRRSSRRWFIINSMVFCLSRSRDREMSCLSGTERGVKPHRGRLSSCFFMCHDVTMSRSAVHRPRLWSGRVALAHSSVLYYSILVLGPQFEVELPGLGTIIGRTTGESGCIDIW